MENFSDGFEEEAATAMEAVAAQLREVTPIRLVTCRLPEIGDRDQKAVLAELDADIGVAQTAVYSITLPDADPAKTHAALTHARTTKLDNRAYSRVLSLPADPTNVIYVGSCGHDGGRLSTRLLQHLGFGYPRTYSLHLRHWGHGLGSIIISARIYPDSLSSKLLCALEDHMAAKLGPLFGKRGSV